MVRKRYLAAICHAKASSQHAVGVTLPWEAGVVWLPLRLPALCRPKSSLPSDVWVSVQFISLFWDGSVLPSVFVACPNACAVRAAWGWARFCAQGLWGCFVSLHDCLEPPGFLQIEQKMSVRGICSPPCYPKSCGKGNCS